MTQDAKDCEWKMVGDRGKPGTTSHAIELEMRIPRRDAIRLLVPFILATMIAPNESKPLDKP